MDREERDTMITALTNCESAEEGECPEDCPMKDDEWKREGRAACRALVDDEIIVPAALIRRTVALLQAQEPMMVEERADTDTINCPKCGQQFARVGCDNSIYLDTDEEPNYCPKCGQAVKWE